MSAAAPDLSVVVLSWNTLELTRRCLHSVFGADQGVALEVIVVENASHDGSAEMVAREFPAARLVRNERNEGYARGNNQGIALANAPLVLLLNSDAEVQPGAIRSLVDFLRAEPAYGGAAPRLVNADGSVQRACMRFPGLAVGLLYDSWFERRFGRSRAVRRYFMEDFDHLHDADVDQPPGACLLLRRDLLARIGGFDESLFLFFNDVELCRAIADTGLKIRYLAGPAVLHHGGRSTAQYRDFVSEWATNRVRYYRKRHGLLGVLTIKTSFLLRAVEEWWKTRRQPAGPDRAAALGEIRRVVGRVVRA
jgi:N-acetylglucosaminyl-diphospho-decaprenol L-rhamnosyltransferase